MEYVSVQQAAADLGLSIRGVRARIERGEIDAQRIGLRTWAIPQTELDRLRGQGKMKPGPKPGRMKGAGVSTADDSSTVSEGQ